MTQATSITLAPHIDGTTQRTQINDMVEAILTGSSGPSRPTYITTLGEGTWMQDSGGTTVLVYYFDGASDVLMGTINKAAHTFTPAGQLATFANTVTNKTGNFTAVAGDFGGMFTVDATAGAVVASIDPTAGLGSSWYTILQKTDATANTVTIDPDSSNQINGATTLLLRRQFDAVIVIKISSSAFVGMLLPNTSLLAPLNSPALTGNPTAPTQSAGNNSTRIATTAYADGAIAALSSVYAPIASPAFTGNPTAPTQSPLNNSTRLATTAYADAAVAASAGIKVVRRQILLTSGTYTPDPHLVMAFVRILGGGAGGSYTGGGAGGYAEGWFTAAAIGASQSVTIGSKGIGHNAGTGALATYGGNTTFGALMTANGGTVNTVQTNPNEGAAGGAASGGSLCMPGQAGGNTQVQQLSGSFLTFGGGDGGNSVLGGAGRGRFFGAGTHAPAYSGSGGSGAQGSNGGNGGEGICIIEEYCSA